MPDIETHFACRMLFSGLSNSNMLSEFSREQMSCLGNQIWAKISKNCTDFSYVQDIETLSASMMWYAGSANSNMLSEFSGEQKQVAMATKFWQK